MFGRVRPTDIVRVEREAHDPPVLGTLSIQRVELVLEHLLVIVRLAIPREHTGVIGLAGIGDEDESLAAAYVDGPRLVVDDPRGVVEAASLGHQIVCADSVARAAAEASL